MSSEEKSNFTFKKFKRGLIIFTAGVVSLRAYELVKDFSPENIVTEFFNDLGTGIGCLFGKTTGEEKPSSTMSKPIESIGKSLDKQMGETTSWDTTSDVDTYGEAVSGIFGAYFNNGKYITQKPSNEEMRNYIDDDLKEVYTLINADEEPESFSESLKMIFAQYVGTDHHQLNYNESRKIYEKALDFVFTTDKFHDKDIKFIDMDTFSQLYFLDNIESIDKIIESKYPQYKEDYNNDLYKNGITKIEILKRYVDISTSDEELTNYKNSLLEKEKTR